MTVRCPHCSTGYLLPDHLLGERGARVRCPTCGGGFVVLPAADGGEGRDRSLIAESTSDGGSPSTPVGGPELLSGIVAADLFVSSHRSLSATDRPAPTRDPVGVAADVLKVLESFLGEALTRSRACGTVLSDHGPAIIAVWQEYRRRAGADAPSAVFRLALRERCGVDLTAAHEG